MAGLNVCVGIDAGSSCSKLGYSDNLSTRIIARPEGFDLLRLREEAEIFFDDPVYSCVVASRDGDIRAENSGFRDVNIITQHEAMCTALGKSGRVLVYDFGASRSELVVIDGHEVLDSVIIPDVCGSVFDGIFAEYLAERRLIDDVDDALLREARRIKHVLSQEENTMWHGHNIAREDFVRLVRFSIKRAGHTAGRLMRVHSPVRFVLTGGGAEIPAIQEIFAEFRPEIQRDIVVVGASLKAKETGKENKRSAMPKTDTSSRLRELRAGLIELEEKLTRPQKDRFYLLFRQAEGINDAGIIAIMENLIREIKSL